MPPKANSQQSDTRTEDSLHSQAVFDGSGEDITGAEIARLWVAGGTSTWLADEPDVYDDICRQPLT